ncbi:MAG: glutamate--tRNA ligase [Candidatus Marinimicrobia bacterium]|nr:glutamate--tRNA ligase [Candidatus Neomarinimicrobiota bacterium]
MKILNILKKQKGKKVRTRVAPSPTGPLHVGTTRTAFFNYLFARQHKGDFVLRIEDTDTQRSDKRFEKDIIDGLEWLDLKYDEFYRQSERKDIYEKYVDKIIKNGKAFWCYHTLDELNKEKTRQMQNREAPKHVCSHKNETPPDFENKKRVLRLRGVDKKIKFNDLIRGSIEYNGSLFGDIVIARDEKTPLYNLAVVIDDHEMEISHIIRGEDHIPNTPKQILIQEALGIKRPLYAHIPLILGTDRSKLSKRHGASSVNEYKKNGYLANAFRNFMVLLGWNPGDNKEFFNEEELLKEFSLKNVQKGGAVFNIEKLDWFNKEYIKNTPLDELSKELLSFIPEEWEGKIKENNEYWEKIIKLEKPRLIKLSEIKERIEFFFDKPNPTKSLLVWKKENMDKTVQHLDTIANLLSNLDSGSFTQEKIKETIWEYTEENGRGNVLWPFRVALTGLSKSPDPFSVAEILGKEECLKRVTYAKNMIYGNPSY